MLRGLKRWRQSFTNRKKYGTSERGVFFDLVIPQLPENKESIVVDIGAGSGGFAKRLNLAKQYENLVLLDGNEATVDILREKGFNAKFHRVPDTLPFDDNSVSLMHCSHMVEHLYYKDLYGFMVEIDRVLSPNGVFVVSTPMIWKNFYNDLSHVKPYNPSVFINYLCKRSDQPTGSPISSNFSVVDLIFRYNTEELSFLGANTMVVDFFIQLYSIFMSKILGIKRYTRNGYTLILKKSDI